MKMRKLKRILSLCLTALLTLAIAAQAEGFSAIVTAGKMKVYADEARTWQIGALPATTVVTVNAVSGQTAQIQVNGYNVYAKASEMAALSEIATRVETNTATRIYRQPDLGSAWLSIPKGMEMNLLAVNGPWAMVENGGVVAYTNKAHLSEVKAGSAPEKEPEKEPEKAEGSGDQIVVESFTAKVAADSMRVYRSASASSACLGMLLRSAVVTVHAYNSQWAFIEVNGNFGFAKIESMERVVVGEHDYITDSALSVEQIIYMFLVREMGLNTAVACGILANVEKECNFRVTAASSDGGYGICQWTGVRNTRLKNWCGENGFDYATLEGQLWYLKYELETHHPKTLRYLKGVENTPAGAYDAGHYFCYNFEVPANRAKRAVERGNLAKDDYWFRYAS